MGKNNRMTWWVWIFSVICLVLAVGSVTASSEEVLVREATYVLEQHGQTIGYDIYRKYQTPEGYLYTNESVVYVTLLDGSHDQNRYYHEVHVDSEYWPIRQQMTSESSGVVTTVQTEFERQGEGIKAVAVTTVSNREFTEESEAQSRAFCPSEAILDYLAESGYLEVGYQTEVYVWSADRGSFVLAPVEVLEEMTFEYGDEERPAYLVSIVENDVPLQMLVSPEGMFYSISFPTIDVQSRLMRPDETLSEFSPMVLDMVGGKGNVEVSHPLRATNSRIKISFDGLPIGASSFSDNRQRVVSESINPDGVSEVVVDISVDTTDRSGRAALPVTDPNLQEYLGTTKHITPDYQSIKEAALQVIGDETDVYKAVEKLLDFTHDYIDYDITLEILTAPDIFERRQGRCTEFAILFASLTRAVGIPTRLVFGFRYDGTTWLGHMWNEVYIDEWVAVDPTQGQMAPDALLVKLAHGSDLTGEENLQATVFTGHRLYIDSVTLKELVPPEGIALETGISGNHFTSLEHACRISAPESWLMSEAEEGGQWMLVMQHQLGGASALLMAFDAPLGAPAEDVLASTIEQVKSQMAVEVLGSQEAFLGNLTGVSATLRIDAGTVTVLQDVTIATAEDIIYVVTLSAVEDMWDLFAEDFQSIKDSFISWR